MRFIIRAKFFLRKLFNANHLRARGAPKSLTLSDLRVIYQKPKPATARYLVPTGILLTGSYPSLCNILLYVQRIFCLWLSYRLQMPDIVQLPSLAVGGTWALSMGFILLFFVDDVIDCYEKG